MRIAIRKIFHPETADQVRRSQLFEAERLQVEHQAAGEMHAALSAVYRMRVERLRKELAGAVPSLIHPKRSEPC